MVKVLISRLDSRIVRLFGLLLVKIGFILNSVRLVKLCVRPWVVVVSRLGSRLGCKRATLDETGPLTCIVLELLLNSVVEDRLTKSQAMYLPQFRVVVTWCVVDLWCRRGASIGRGMFVCGCGRGRFRRCDRSVTWVTLLIRLVLFRMLGC